MVKQQLEKYQKPKIGFQVLGIILASVFMILSAGLIWFAACDTEQGELPDVFRKANSVKIAGVCHQTAIQPYTGSCLPTSETVRIHRRHTDNRRWPDASRKFPQNGKNASALWPPSRESRWRALYSLGSSCSNCHVSFQAMRCARWWGRPVRARRLWRLPPRGKGLRQEPSSWRF